MTSPLSLIENTLFLRTNPPIDDKEIDKQAKIYQLLEPVCMKFITEMRKNASKSDVRILLTFNSNKIIDAIDNTLPADGKSMYLVMLSSCNERIPDISK